MKSYIYPAIFTPEAVGGFSVSFPDLAGCATQGDDIADAVEMAKDALGLYLSVLEEDGSIMPEPSDPTFIKAQNGSFIALIDFNSLEYKRKHSAKAVKKTLSIPQWLNTMAEREGINFSSTLQEALKSRLGLQ